MKNDRKRIVYLEFLNRCGLECTVIPKSAWVILRYADYKSFVEPMIIEDSKELSQGKLAIKYGLSVSKIKYILSRKNKNNGSKFEPTFNDT